MSAKKRKSEEERKPDLAAPDQEAIEQRVREMLDISEEAKKPAPPLNEKTESTAKTITVTHHEEEPKSVEEPEEPTEPEPIASAPVLPGTDEEIDTQEPEVADSEAQEELVQNESVEEPEEPTEKILNLDEAPKDDALISENEILAEPLLEDESSEEAEPEEPTEPEPLIEEALDDPKTSKAVDEIIAQEGDDLLAAEDEKAGQTVSAGKKAGIGKRLTGFFKAWWNNPKARWGTIVGLLVLVGVILAVPTSRYAVLNTVGLRSQVVLVVIDDSTGQPLKNVQVTVGGVSEKTDSNGKAQLDRVKLGSSELVISRRAFAEEKKKTTVRLGKNDLGPTKLKPVGVQYSFFVTDFLSDKPIEKIEAVNGEASAFSDSEGKIKLTIDKSDDDGSFEVSIKAEGYREEKLTLTEESITEQPVKLIPARKHVFVSKQTGKYNLYTVDADGKNEKMVLEGTGSEREDIDLATHPVSDVTALVSTRDNQRNKDGYLLSRLTFIDLQTDQNITVTTSERIQLIDWVGDRLIYVQATSGASATNPERHKLMSYNFRTNENKQLAASNYFNDVLVAKGKVYYAPSSAYQTGNNAQLYRIEADGSGKTVVVNKEIWSLFRTDYDNLAASAQQDWLNIRLGEDKATSLSAQPANLVSKSYTDSPDNKQALWVDNRDGKGVLLAFQPSTKDEITLRSQAGLKTPVRWFSNKAVVYRVSNNQETADYIISLDGGEPKKIHDVTNTGSVDKWYYY
jgi:hypothetical protein